MTTGDVGAAALRRLLNGRNTIVAPGVFSPAVALLAKRAGFRCAYFSGAGFANLMGLPDLGVTTLSEVTRAVAETTSVANMPLIVDVDTGFGEAVNLARTVREMERVGAAGIQVEDQVMPKRCGHLSGKEVVASEEMVKKIITARRARRTNMLIIARTDAAAVEGINSAIDRAKLYVRAGADIIFPEALETKEDFLKFSRNVRSPLLANMTEFGKSPYLSVSEFQRMGYKIVVFPVTAFRAAMKAVQETFRELSRAGTQRRLLSSLMTRNEFYELIGYRAYEELDHRMAVEAALLNKS